MFVTKVFIVLLAIVNICASYNILGVFPHLGKSHFLVYEPLFKALAKKGHNLTVISYFPQENVIPNYRDISLCDPNISGTEVIGLEEVTGSRMEKYTGANFILRLAGVSCPSALSNDNFQAFLKEENQFDIILAELFNTNCYFGIFKKYKAPVIGLSTCVPIPWIESTFGNSQNPAYIPTTFMDYSDQMTFLERVENTITLLLFKLQFKMHMENEGNELSKKYIGEDLMKGGDINTSLLLSNTHFTLNRPKPLVPNIIEVGGIHVGTPKKLPANIEKWINESTDGVIYFSLGSMIRGHTFPKEKRDAFLKVFSRLPQRVLWKWENETMEGKPDNVMIQKWMPQLDILCHPNVKAFIAHGGLLGITEAVHCGVPVVVMPQFGDQHTNARAVEASGGGVILQLSEATEDKVYKALKKVLSSDFRQKAKELSERFRDRPLPPLETAIYWVEYVARHRGAPHMRTAAADMPFYKYYLIDVIAFILLIIGSVIYSLYYVARLVLKLILRQSQKVKVS